MNQPLNYNEDGQEDLALAERVTLYLERLNTLRVELEQKLISGDPEHGEMRHRELVNSFHQVTLGIVKQILTIFAVPDFQPTVSVMEAFEQSLISSTTPDVYYNDFAGNQNHIVEQGKTLQLNSDFEALVLTLVINYIFERDEAELASALGLTELDESMKEALRFLVVDLLTQINPLNIARGKLFEERLVIQYMRDFEFDELLIKVFIVNLSRWWKEIKHDVYFATYTTAVDLYTNILTTKPFALDIAGNMYAREV